ncbi:cortical patch protein [Aspergillus sclerotialis]|uniref:Cortical patch protein n=1 Tax=Aspergillus sclerotialis TaxID=2070753 RepID=A0A3A2ZBV3_9EURO|nr:cortical patch protein [Aspergillus sclerotialis]
MALGRAMFGFLGLFFIAGAILLIILTLLGGVTNTNPENIIFFLEANTGNIPGAPAVSRWTFWNVCAMDANQKSLCGPSHPDYPFDPPSHRTFNTTVNVPPEFVGSNHYFLTSRFMFPFIIIGLFFAVLALFMGLLALCTRIGGVISAIFAWISFVFQTITTCLMTAVYVQGRNNFNRNGQRAHLGAKAFAFMWTALTCLFLGSIFYLVAGLVGRKREGYIGREQRRRGFFKNERSASTHEHSES